MLVSEGRGWNSGLSPEPGQRAELGALQRAGRCVAPIVIGRDRLDTGSVASLNSETEGMKDGSDAVVDQPLLYASDRSRARRANQYGAAPHQFVWGQMARVGSGADPHVVFRRHPNSVELSSDSSRSGGTSPSPHGRLRRSGCDWSRSSFATHRDTPAGL